MLVSSSQHHWLMGYSAEIKGLCLAIHLKWFDAETAACFPLFTIGSRVRPDSFPASLLSLKLCPKKDDNVGITIISHPQITMDTWYNPFPNGWFIIVIPTLFCLTALGFLVGHPGFDSVVTSSFLTRLIAFWQVSDDASSIKFPFFNPRCEPWCWNIYLHLPKTCPSFVGKYTSTRVRIFQWVLACFQHVEKNKFGLAPKSLPSLAILGLPKNISRFILIIGDSYTGGMPIGMVYRGKFHSNGWFVGTPILGNHHMLYPIWGAFRHAMK